MDDEMIRSTLFLFFSHHPIFFYFATIKAMRLYPVVYPFVSLYLTVYSIDNILQCVVACACLSFLSSNLKNLLFFCPFILFV